MSGKEYLFTCLDKEYTWLSNRLARALVSKFWAVVALLLIALPVPALGNEIAVGDRLRLNVFETFERRDLTGRVDSELRDFIERPDLSGEFVVSREGSLFLPLAGLIDVAGLSLAAAAVAIEEKLENIISVTPRVGINIIAREPVYITGDVLRPGVVDHVPGMTVLHALTISGGMQKEDREDWLRLDISRERERLAQSQTRLATLLATVDVLEAMQNGGEITPSPQLVSLVNTRNADRLVNEIEEVERLGLARLVNDDSSYARAIVAAEAELTALRRGVADTERMLVERRERTRILEEALTRRRTTLQILSTAQSELAEVLHRRDSILTSIARIEREIEQLRREQSRSDLDSRINLAERLTRMRAEIAQEEVTVEMLSENLRLYTGVVPSRGSERLSFEIIRRTADGSQRIPADELTDIKPGDMINVKRIGDTRRASR